MTRTKSGTFLVAQQTRKGLEDSVQELPKGGSAMSRGARLATGLTLCVFGVVLLGALAAGKVEKDIRTQIALIGGALLLTGGLLNFFVMRNWSVLHERDVAMAQARVQMPTLEGLKRIRRAYLTVFLSALILAVVIPTLLTVLRLPTEESVGPVVGIIGGVLIITCLAAVAYSSDVARRVGFPKSELTAYSVLALIPPFTILSFAVFDRAVHDFIRKSEGKESVQLGHPDLPKS